MKKGCFLRRARRAVVLFVVYALLLTMFPASVLAAEPAADATLSSLLIATSSSPDNTNTLLTVDDIDGAVKFEPGKTDYQLRIGDQFSTLYFAAVPADDGSTVKLEYTDTQSNEQRVTLQSDGTVKKVSKILEQGKRNFAVRVTPAAGSDKQEVLYSFAVDVVPVLSELKLSDESGNAVHFSPKYDRDTNEYNLRVLDTVKTLKIGALLQNEGATVTYNGSDSPQINTEGLTSIDIDVKLSGKDGLENTYHLNVKIVPPASVSINTEPENARVTLYDKFNERVLPDAGGAFQDLRTGDEYTYTVTLTDYVGKRESFTPVAGVNTVAVTLGKAAKNEAIDPSIISSWPNFRGNDANNGVVNALTPQKADEATLYWATKYGEGWDSGALSSPILVDGNIIATSSTNIVKMDTQNGEIIQTGTMVTTSNFNITSPTYAEGMIFVALKDGIIQAFNADTLESLWVYHDQLRGQPNTPIVYNDGYIYTGFWNSETRDANFVCLSATDEDPAQPAEEKLPTWAHPQLGGFYWAGAYAGDNFLLVGTDDGDTGYLADTSNLLSLDPESGEIIDRISGLNGDIRSTVAYDEVTDRYYFTTKGGSFYGVKVNENGTFAREASGVQGYDLKEILLDNGGDNPNNPPMSTSTPVVYNGRAYVGVSGTSQFKEFTGHNITVLDLVNWKIAYKAPTKGYPQTSGLLTTAYESGDGYVYVYFIDNYTPGMIRVIKDKPGVTALIDPAAETYTDNKGTHTVHGVAPVLFTPVDAQAQYAICSPIIDEYGTMYFKNDSAHMMALGSKIKSIEVTKQPTKTSYQSGEAFDPAGMEVVANLANGLQKDVTKYVTYSTDPLRANDLDITIYYNHVMYQDVFDQENGNQINVKVNPPQTVVDLDVAPGEVNRIAGGNRYDTSAETALDAYPDGAETVIIARGDDEGNFADGLAASYLAGVKDAPVLLTSTGSLSDAVKNAIKKLEAKNAIVLGGTLAVSANAETELKGLGLTVKRLNGANRYDTAAKIAAEGGNAETAIVVSGFAPADSLVAGPVAFSQGYPLLLVDKNSVPAETKKAIADLGIKKIIVVGGENVVSKAVYNELGAHERYAGQSRIETSLKVAEKSFAGATDFSIVGYLKLADAVGAAVNGNPIIYVKGDLSDVQDYLTKAPAANFTIFGGPLAVNKTVENELKELLR
jgi:putative cell wall-binding protein